jgi:hypothetical protein
MAAAVGGMEWGGYEQQYAVCESVAAPAWESVAAPASSSFVADQPMTYQMANDAVRAGVQADQFRSLPIPGCKIAAHANIASKAGLKIMRVLHARYFSNVPLNDVFDFLWGAQPAICIDMKDGSRCCTPSKANSFYCGHHCKIDGYFEQCVANMASGVYFPHPGK